MMSLPLLAIAGMFLAPGDIIVPRGGGDVVQGEITRLDEDGIFLRIPGETEDDMVEVMFSWDRVADVRITGPVQPRLPELMETAETLWRARSRLDRGDMANAEPILELQFPGMVGRTSETALVISDGLLRCRLDRGANAEALLPGLEMARLRRAGVTTSSDARRVPPVLSSKEIEGVVPVWDPEFSLIPYLPPVWLDGPGVANARVELEGWSSDDDPLMSTIAGLYQAGLEQDLGNKISPMDLDSDTISDEKGTLLLGQMINAVHADPDVRKDARRRLQNRPSNDPPWVEGWVRYQLGRSYLMEEGTGQRRKGQLNLAHVVARSSQAQPYLAGVAMAIMAAEFESTGDLEAAERLRGDLARSTPRHPVLRTPTLNPSRPSLGDGKENP